MVKYAIYIIYFDDESKAEAERVYGSKPWARLMFNETTQYAEQYTIMSLIEAEDEWKDLDYVGFLSWKAHMKMTVPDNFDDLKFALENNVDFLYLLSTCNYFFGKPYFDRIDTVHPLFSKIWKMLLNEMGFSDEDIFSPEIREFVCSYYIVSTKILKHFLGFMITAKNILENTKLDDLRDFVNRNSLYPHIPKKISEIGKPYYDYRAFLFERLPNFYVTFYKKNVIPYQRIKTYTSIPQTFSKKSNKLCVYVYTGKNKINFKNFLSANHSGKDCIIVLNTDYEDTIDHIPVIKRLRPGVVEAWSDVMFFVQRDYEYYILFSDSNPFSSFEYKWDEPLIDMLSYDRAFLNIGITENEIKNIIINNIGMKAVYDVLFYRFLENEDSIQSQIINAIGNRLRDYSLCMIFVKLQTRILITGGCGFIGSNFINHIYYADPSSIIVNVDAMYYCANEKNIKESIRSDTDRYTFYNINLADGVEKLVEILKSHGITKVIHFAAQSHVDNSFSIPLQYTRDNIYGTHNLLEACKTYGAINKFIHISTDEVYGESMISSDEQKKTEESILCPTNPYAASKAGAELIVQSYYHSFKFPIIITRGNNVYGPNQYPEKLIPKFIELLRAGKKVPIHGNGESVRAFLHVSDVCSAVELILKKGKIGEIYNIGSDDYGEMRVIDVAKLLIQKITGRIDTWEEFIEKVEDRPFNDKRYYISNEKLKKLGWVIKTGFEDGLRELIYNESQCR